MLSGSMPVAAVISPAVKEVILGAMRVVTSADKAYRLLRSAGYEFTREFIRWAWKEVGQADYWKTVLHTWGNDRRPPAYWSVEKTSETGKGYQMIIEYTTQDWVTGEIETRYASKIYDKIVPFAEVRDDLAGDLELYGETYGFSVIDIRPGGIAHLV